MGTNLQGYHLLWPDLPTFSQLQFTAPAPLPLGKSGGLLVYPSSNPRMKPGEKERSEHEAEERSSSPKRRGTKLRVCFSSKPQSALARRY